MREDNVEKGFRDGDSWLNSSKREALKFGRAQLRQCHEIEVLTRAFQLVGLIFMHFLWIHWSHESHCTCDWLILQGREHTPQGLLEEGPGLVSTSPERIRRERSQ